MFTNPSTGLLVPFFLAVIQTNRVIKVKHSTAAGSSGEDLMACCTTDRIIDSHGQEMASFIPKSFTNCVLQKYIRTIKVFCIVTLKLKHIFIIMWKKNYFPRSCNCEVKTPCVYIYIYIYTHTFNCK